MLRGNNRRRLFSYQPDYRRMLGFIEDALSLYPVLLHALVLMANHLHLIVTPAGAPALAGFVKSFAQRYAQYRNRRRGSTGKLFEQRYLSKTVPDERYLATLTAYVELNPVRAGLAEDPFAYPWSTYPLHAGLAGGMVPPRMWTPSDWYLSLGDTWQERGDRFSLWTRDLDERSLSPEHLAQIRETEFLTETSGRNPEWRPSGERAA